jgi:mRNA (guanine-N7-)-methyltransferase
MENLFINSKISDLMECINGKDSEGNDFKIKNPPYNKVKDEFNKFIKKEIETRRSLSTIAEMRKFHNDIKRKLLVNISNYIYSKTKKPVNLIDIAVGRGGDLQKWKEARIKNVFGFDNNEESINSVNPFNQGAKERYRLLKTPTNVIFEVGDATNPSKVLIENLVNFCSKNPVSIISCQFALHYFFKSDQTLKKVLSLVSNCLQPGGYFVGTTTDGKKIKEHNGTLFEIHKKGKGYSFKINDSVDEGNYFNTIPESLEYYTDFKKLTRFAAEYNLVPDNTNFLEEKGLNQYTKLNITGEIVNTQSFDDIPHFSFNMTPEQLELNSLYTTFLYKKI